MQNGLRKYGNAKSEPEGFDLGLCGALQTTGTEYGNWYFWGYYSIPTGECHTP